MMDAADIIARLKARVVPLGGRVQGAADYLRLTASGGEPQQTPMAFVLPTGLQGGPHSGLVGSFRQPVDRLFSVVLVLRADATTTRSLDQAGELIEDIVGAVVGWDGSSGSTAGLVGVFVLRRAQLIKSPPGSLAWDITFSIQDLIRKAA